MANPYSGYLRGASDDGTNTYLLIEITDGTRTMPLIQMMVPTGTSASLIQTLIQNMATNQPTVATTLQSLINVQIAGQ